MAFIADLERLLERVFERSSARLFRTRVQVVQLEHRVERAMERARLPSAGRTAVPARYRVRLHPSDVATVGAEAGSPEALAARLADAALAFARAHGYHLRGRPMVSLVADSSLAAGEVEVDAVADPPTGWAGDPGGDAVAAIPVQVLVRPSPSGEVTAAVSAGLPEVSPAPGVRGDGTQTLVFRRPAPQAARAILRVFAPDGAERTVQVNGPPLTIGRARDNGLVLGDPRVSRHHGRLLARHGALVYADLGSTNGTRVNGIRVDEIVLGEGDRLQLGDSVLVVEMLPG